MLTNYTQEQIWEQYRKLPDEIKNILWADDTNNLFLETVQKYNIQKNDVFSMITMRVIMGLTPVQQYRKTLQEELEISEETARQIAYEVRDKLFVKIAEQLSTLHNIYTKIQMAQ